MQSNTGLGTQHRDLQMPLAPDPRYSARLRAAREQLGLMPNEVERRAGLPSHFLEEVEAYPDEVTSVIGLDALAALCGVLGLQPAALLAHPDERLPEVPVRAEELAGAIRARMTAEGLSAEEFGSRAGWAVEPLLDDPPAGLGSLNVDGLFDICAAAGVSWLAALPAAITRVGA